MENVLCKGGTQRNRLAVSLCFAAANLLSLEALRPGICEWLGMDNKQSFALSASFATVCMFLATFILTQIISGQASSKPE